jgi:hypothetical protein
MFNYRVFNLATGAIRRIAIAIVAVAALLTFAGATRIAVILQGIYPALGFSFLALLALLLLFALVRLRNHRNAHRILHARGLTISGRSSHKKRAASLKHHTHCCRRLASSRLLDRERSTSMLQEAHDLEDLFHHHPLNDDLDRAIATARDNVLNPAYREFDEVYDRIVFSKSRSLIEDAFDPALPMPRSWSSLHHLFTLVCEITDIYLPRPSLGEYRRVIGDVRDVMMEGDFLRYGQRSFAALDAEKNNFGSIFGDAGEMFSALWVFACVSRVTRARCQTLHDWDLDEATANMNSLTDECLRDTCSLFARIAIPLLKIKARRAPPLSGQDASAQPEEIAARLNHALDRLVMARGAHPGHTVEFKNTIARETERLAQLPDNAPAEGHHHRHRSRRHRNTLHRLIDRLAGNHHSHHH